MVDVRPGRWEHTRRRFLKGTLVGAGAASISVMDQLGGAKPAEAGPPTCFDPHGFQYRGGVCAPPSYPTDCNKGGCARSGIRSNTLNCPSNGNVYKERHRTCGEDVVVNGDHKQFALRLNECDENFPTDWDGWEWFGAGESDCNCAPPTRILFSCNDGYLRINGGGWLKSICMTSHCFRG